MENNSDGPQTLRPVSHYWPAWSKEATKLIGCEMVAKIMAHFGGTRIYIPYQAKGKSALLKLIGVEAVMALIPVYGGQTVEVPKGEISAITLRNRMIGEDRKAGLTCTEIARKYRLTERSVRNVYRKLWG